MRLALATVAILLAAGPARAASRPPAEGGRDAGWWIVVGSGPEPNADHPSISAAVNAAAARCGFSTFDDFSAKFSGFNPGYEVFVIGAYRSEQEADHRLTMVRRCIHSAYLKSGSYAGE